MKIAIATVQVPFIRGGAENLAGGLGQALQAAGHEVDQITMPFQFAPVQAVERSMAQWTQEDWTQLNGHVPDRVICLKFPTFYLNHPNKVTWILHQHRAVYDLWNTPYTQGFSNLPEATRLKQAITQQDTEALGACRHNFTIAKNVSKRLQRFNGLASTALYHPPKLADHLYTAEAEPYIFFPSRLEQLKRQDLLIQAFRYVKSPVVGLIAGEGGQKGTLQQLIADYDLSQRVRLLGQITEAEMLAFYAHALGVFFGPYDEDYGYVTLEAMLSQKPVITCQDSGEPAEFVVDQETGYIVDPDPQSIAAAIDQLYANASQARQMGQAGLERYRALNISWDFVVEQLLG
ncbi:glycosyltransferase family 4 protein [Alkalinema pantanalense CENA528]|uniref:glycosyltransferase family 4 protein n=1 Tax=Alkalinema pantanalense TaxID=1620705 RepID=UPI003D6F7D93